MILVRANPLLWPLEEVGLKIWTFLGSNSNSLRWLPFQGTKKYRFLGLTPSKALEWIYPHQNHYVPLYINNRYITEDLTLGSEVAYGVARRPKVWYRM